MKKSDKRLILIGSIIVVVVILITVLIQTTTTDSSTTSSASILNTIINVVALILIVGLLYSRFNPEWYKKLNLTPKQKLQTFGTIVVIIILCFLLPTITTWYGNKKQDTEPNESSSRSKMSANYAWLAVTNKEYGKKLNVFHAGEKMQYQETSATYAYALENIGDSATIFIKDLNDTYSYTDHILMGTDGKYYHTFETEGHKNSGDIMIISTSKPISVWVVCTPSH